MSKPKNFSVASQKSSSRRESLNTDMISSKGENALASFKSMGIDINPEDYERLVKLGNHEKIIFYFQKYV